MAMAVISLAITVGGMLLQALMKPKQKDSYGSRLADVNVPSVSPGNPITRLWGTMKLAGQIVWVSKLIETKHSQSQQSGGKGMGGKGGPKSYTYTYAVDVAIAICRGPVYQVNRIWANQKLLWVNPVIMAQAQADFKAAYEAEFTRLVEQEYMTNYDMAYASSFFFAFNNYREDEYTYQTHGEALAFINAHPASSFTPPAAYPAPNSSEVDLLLTKMLDGLGRDKQYASNKIRFDQMDLYLGDETQTPNSKIESWIGVGEVPSFRGIAYFVLHNLQLEDFGDAVPTFNIEVQESATAQTTFLYEIIQDICAETGLTPSEYDTSSYMDLSVTVDGYALTQATTARDAIAQLQKVFPFDAAETNFKLVFSWINHYPKMLVRREDFGAHIDSEQMPTSEEVKRLADLDLPKRLNLKFQERARNFSPNMVFAQRMTTSATTVDERDITIALKRADAKKWAEEQLALTFTARRHYKIILPRKYVIIEPGDIILVPDKDYADTRYGLRCIETNIGNNGLMEASFIDHYFHVDMKAETADDNAASYDGSPTTIPKGSPTVPYFLDTPLLTDTEADNVGYYAVLAGVTSGWLGGLLLIDMGGPQTVTAYNQQSSSVSTGSNWVSLVQQRDQSPHGFAMTKLSDKCHPLMWDYISSVTIYMRNPDFALASASKDDLLTQPLNLALFGDELVQFANATDLGNGVWRLDTFLRGLRGTEDAIKTHVVGERFVRLRQASTERVTHDQRYLGISHNYRAVTFGDNTDSAANFTFTNTGNSLRPRAPMLRAAYRDSARNAVLTWIPRARQNGNLISGRTVTLDQATESYEIDVMDGLLVKRTYVLADVRTWTYSSAQQMIDFGSSSGAINCNIYQIGKIVGRGYKTEITV